MFLAVLLLSIQCVNLAEHNHKAETKPRRNGGGTKNKLHQCSAVKKKHKWASFLEYRFCEMVEILLSFMIS